MQQRFAVLIAVSLGSTEIACVDVHLAEKLCLFVCDFVTRDCSDSEEEEEEPALLLAAALRNSWWCTCSTERPRLEWK